MVNNNETLILQFIDLTSFESLEGEGFKEGTIFITMLLLLVHYCTNTMLFLLEPPSPIEVNGEQGYEVNEILDSKLSNRQLQYLVHWQGYDINEDTWEPSKHLLNTMENMKKIHRRYPNKPKVTTCGTCC